MLTTVFYPMRRNASGLIIYSPDGYMSAQIMKTGRPPYAAGEMQDGTTEELSIAARGYLATQDPTVSMGNKRGCISTW